MALAAQRADGSFLGKRTLGKISCKKASKATLFAMLTVVDSFF